MTAKTDTIYQLKITLDKIKPSIWRRVQVKGSSSLADMHRVIQIVMGWNNSHMHQFIVGGVNYGDASFDDEVEDESAVTLTQIVPEEQSKFRYEYDFGDDWMHTIVVEKILPAAAGVKYPRCTAGKRACPPDDIGGPFAYPDFLAAIADPANDQHDALLEWVGGAFNPEKFSVVGTNHMLRGYSPYKTWLPKETP